MKSLLKNSFQLLKDFLRFISSPDPELVMKAWNAFTILQMILVNLVLLAVGSALALGMSFLFEGKTLESNNPADVAVMNSLPLWAFFMAACITAPLGEELFLRLPLKKRWDNLVISFGAGVGMLLFFNELAYSRIFSGERLSFDAARFVIPLIVVGLAATYYALPAHYRQKKVIFGLFLYIMAFIFAVLHRFDRIHEPFDVILAFRDTTLQFLGGLYYSFLRMRFGIRFSILTHSIWNFLPFVLKWITLK